MKIVVCIKEVMDVTFPFVLDQANLGPLQDDIFYRANPADMGAVEAALTIQEKVGAEVSLITFGPPRVEKTLRDCLAMGGDRAVRVWDDRVASGSQAKAFVLAKAAASFSPDLVLCGNRSLDEGSGETPVAIAEYLGFTQVTGVVGLELSSGGEKAVVSRKLEKGRREAIECPLPAVLALEVGAYQPRYAGMPRTLDACRAQLSLMNGEELEIHSTDLRELDSLRRLVRQSLPRPRPKKTFSMESGLTAEQRMELMMSGGLKQGKSDLLEGTPKDLARQLDGILQGKCSGNPIF